MNLRPNKLKDIIGLDNAKQILQTCIESSKQTGDPIPHVLLQGPPGLGKSTLAHAVSNEINTYCSEINGATLTTQKPLINALIKSKKRDIIFVDEIHAMPTKSLEMLYTPLEDKRLVMSYVNPKTKQQHSISQNLESFTFIGATTNIGLLPKPLVDRMPIHIFLDFYSDEDIAKIIGFNLTVLKIKADDAAILGIAKRAKGTPRVANSYCQWIKDYSIANKIARVTLSHINAAFDMYGIDENGLNNNDIKYLDVLKKSPEPLGVKAISSMTDIPESCIEEQIEPFLLRKGLIQKTKRGRIDAQNSLESILQILEGN